MAQNTELVSCSHCGQCCIAITCQLAQVLLHVSEDTLCPALEQEEGLYYCGLIRNTAKYIAELVGSEPWKASFLRQQFSQLLGIGYGCDSMEAK